ncbi:MAG: hypothetical protein Q7J43_04215 [Pseudomonas sp.]|nr:hypothetical protein [Pseudomonas sp.]MDO9616869.1 hypothetical protein [Pseudomonas sp.]
MGSDQAYRRETGAIIQMLHDGDITAAQRELARSLAAVFSP